MVWRRYPWLVAWGAFALLCTALMWLFPGSETLPYHLAWAGLALAFGFERWTLTMTVWALGLFTSVTGVVLVVRASQGVLDWQETCEVPLMLLLMVLMVWHVRRRQSALADVTLLAERERAAASARELLTLRTSHELRSPLTIARGFVEVLLARTTDPDDAADLRIVDEELVRLTRVGDRLVRSMRLQGEHLVGPHDIDALIGETARRWSTVAARDWRVRTHVGSAMCSPERLRAVLDTLVENAVRYTDDGETIELFAREQDADTLVIGVADSGPGLSDASAQLLLSAADRAEPPSLERDARSQTGLGLGLVIDVAHERGGRIVVERSRFGGAEVALVVPRRPRTARSTAVTASTTVTTSETRTGGTRSRDPKEAPGRSRPDSVTIS